jgi:predicted MFS family arabinose efflux permease
VTPQPSAGILRSPLPWIYAILFAEGAMLAVLFPLVPDFERELSLTKVEIGVIFSSFGFAQAFVGVPTGILADRIGARTVTIGASGVLALSSFGQGVAVDFWTLLAARALFGIAAATILVAAIAWLADSVTAERRAAAVGAIVPASLSGCVVGPALGSVLASHYSLATPFMSFAAVIAVITLGLLLAEHGGRMRHERQPLLRTMRFVRTEPFLFAAATIMLVVGASESMVNLLAPDQLDANGLSTVQIGVIFGAAAAAAAVGGLLASQFAGRTVNLRAAWMVAFGLAATMSLLVVSSSTGAVASGVILRMTLLGALVSIGWSMGALGARSAAIGGGVVNGLLIFAQGLGNIISPLAGGALTQLASERLAYATLASGCLAGAILVLMRSRYPLPAQQQPARH